MKNFFRPVFDLVLFGNLFISLCTVAQAMVTFTLIGSKAVYPLLVLLFSSTVFIYNISLLLTKPVEPESSPLLPIRWFFAHQRLMVATTLLSAGVMFFMFLLVSVRSEIALVFLSILSVGYSLPIFKKGDQKFGLRNIPGIKSALISLVWTMSCVLLPILEARAHHLADVSIADAAILIAKRFLFIMALTIPFDIRDLFHDSKSGLKTIPVIFGERGAYLFCQFLLAGYLILLFLFKGDGFSRNFFALGTTTILTGWLIFRAKLEKNEYYYFFFMDGVLILQYIVLLLFNLVR
jgi:4-hydroxybenzoate polyprenyltransferase